MNFLILLQRILRFFQRKISFRKVTIIGDSHARIFFHDLFRIYFPLTSFDVCWVAGATVSGLDNPNSKTQAYSVFKEKVLSLKKDSLVILMLGEVDTGFVIWYRCQLHGGTADEMLGKAILNYRELISLVNSNCRTMVISTPLPTISDDNDWGDVADQRKTITASQFQRTELTLKFNQLIEEYCVSNDITFVNLDADSLGENGLVAGHLVNDDPNDHHYKSGEHARLIIRNLRSKFKH